MYFPKIKKTTAQLEVMIQAIEMQYGKCDDTKLSELIAKYFESDVDDVKLALLAYRTHKPEDYEQISKRQEEYATQI